MPFSYLSKHLVALKIQDKKIVLLKLYFRQHYITRKIDLEGSVSRVRLRIRFLRHNKLCRTIYKRHHNVLKKHQNYICTCHMVPAFQKDCEKQII